jgi:hypothetical protein
MRYLGVTADKRLIWSPQIYQVRKQAAWSMRVLGLPLNRKIILSVVYGVLPYKQLICPMMDYACPIRRFAARVEIMQVLQSKCLRLATVASWYVRSRQIHEDLVVSFFAEIKTLTASFDSNLADVSNPLVRQLGRYLC